MKPDTVEELKIAITLGDPSGIGPEIIVKALSSEKIADNVNLIIVGDRGILKRAEKITGSSGWEEKAQLIEATSLDPSQVVPGRPDTTSGDAQYRYIKTAAKLCIEGDADAMVTCPAHKASMFRAGHLWPGHTELLAWLAGSGTSVMMLAAEKLRVVPLTIHIPLAAVPYEVKQEKIITTCEILHESLVSLFDIDDPLIAVTALNPHAGEGGKIGTEEMDKIIPALEQLEARGIKTAGPFPADSLFFRATRGEYSAVLCMYHDQAMIPIKTLYFTKAVNITLGLPILRTSVSHGTAHDIAGTGTASPESLIEAIKMAIFLVANKRKRRRKKTGDERGHRRL